MREGREGKDEGKGGKERGKEEREGERWAGSHPTFLEGEKYSLPST